MQTKLAPEFAGTAEGDAAEAILRKCVHCGFCTATCPTYQLLGDELDGPRGRIYLIKQMLEGAEVTRKTQVHLDRCLTCLNCESTCPSGVQYGKLVDIGRNIVERKVERPVSERVARTALKEGLTSPMFGPALRVGQAVRPLLPPVLRNKVPPRDKSGRAHRWPTQEHPRKVLMLMGCVQPAMAPNINSATARVLDAVGIQTVVADEAGCCGALRSHMADEEGALADMRRNVDAWWPAVASGRVEAIVMNASGCGVIVKEYGYHLARDPAYADRAARISDMTRDLCELLPDITDKLLAQGFHRGAAATVRSTRTLGYHPPCTLQHGQQIRHQVETHLRTLGFDVRLAATDAHLCCGSAGTYSVLQPDIAYQLRDRKLASFERQEPETIISGNVGCIQHLQSGTETPVKHWVEVLDEALHG